MVSFRYFSGVAVTLPETEPVSAPAAAPAQTSNNAAARKRFLIGMHDMAISPSEGKGGEELERLELEADRGVGAGRRRSGDSAHRTPACGGLAARRFEIGGQHQLDVRAHRRGDAGQDAQVVDAGAVVRHE